MNQIAENSADSHWKRKRVYSIIRAERKSFLLWRKNQLKDFFVAILFIMEEILYRVQFFPEACYHVYIGSELYITMSIFMPIPIESRYIRCTFHRFIHIWKKIISQDRAQRDFKSLLKSSGGTVDSFTTCYFNVFYELD